MNLREQEGPFLRAGGTEVKRLTTERTEVFVLAVRIGALDTGDALGVVAAANELLHHLDDTFDSQSTIDDRVFVFILIGQALKMLLSLEAVLDHRMVSLRNPKILLIFRVQASILTGSAVGAACRGRDLAFSWQPGAKRGSEGEAEQ